jgi:hypothetical protein
VSTRRLVTARTSRTEAGPERGLSVLVDDPEFGHVSQGSGALVDAGLLVASIAPP